MRPLKTIPRCAWVTDDPLYIAYHDEEWGAPEYDDQRLFELLVLEGMQAGLSWLTVLKKREHFKKVFSNFEIAKVARFSQAKVEKLMQDPGIIRNRLKINSAIINANAALQVIDEFGSLSDYFWSFVDGKPIKNKWTSFKDVPCRSEVSNQLSKDIKKRGFKFVGSTICYSFMQAVGLVNDHHAGCYKRGRC